MRKLQSMCTLAGFLAIAMFARTHPAYATNFKVLHSFSGGADGTQPVAGLILDAAGNLYGTTFKGGPYPYDCGTVFELPRGGTEKSLHYFTCGANGELPVGRLLMDHSGNLYGMTTEGGIGCGLVFEVTSGGSERTVHTFAGPPGDGCSPYGNLIEEANGKIYGTTQAGGKDGGGTVFELARGGLVTLLHFFKTGRGGDTPMGGLIVDARNNLYGTNVAGGDDFGDVFELTRERNYHVLYRFKGSPDDGAQPYAGVILDASGNLYGTTNYGGKPGCSGDIGCGIVFELAPDGTETVLHFFSGRHGDGSNPAAGLVADAVGNLYGTTEYGGGHCAYDSAYGCGTVFELAPGGTVTILYSFSKDDAANGALPEAGLVADGNGNYYGTTSEGGAYGYGTIFEITP